MSAPSCSIRRFVSLIARSALSLPQPIPTSFSGCPLIDAPTQPSRGLFGFLAWPPANWDIAVTTPARSWLSNEPNAPWQSDRTPILIGVALLRAVAVVATYAAAITAIAASGTSFHLPLKACIRMPSSFRTVD